MMWSTDDIRSDIHDMDISSDCGYDHASCGVVQSIGIVIVIVKIIVEMMIIVIMMMTTTLNPDTI